MIEPREHLVRALAADLVGPYDLDNPDADEVLKLPPSRWYLTGFLAPELGREEEVDPTEDDELGSGDDENEEETSGQEPEPKQKKRLPASLGMSVLLPPGSRGKTLTATVRYADYACQSQKQEGRRARNVWVRLPRPARVVDLPLDPKRISAGVEVPGSGGVNLVGKLSDAQALGLPKGTQALSLFVVNRRAPAESKTRQDEQFIFQVSLQLDFAAGFVARSNRRGEHSDDWDDRVGDLQFRDRSEYAVGHGVSVEAPVDHPVTRVRTSWMPRAEVRRVKTRSAAGVEVRMEQLAELKTPAEVRTALAQLPEAYGAWIDDQAATPVDTKERIDTRDELVRQARRAQQRISNGVEILAGDPLALESFRLANRAMATAARRRNPERYRDGAVPEWRLFQLAFVLLNVCGVVQDTHPDRKTVELIFFPTGGGKTEAYLGVIAFVLLLRRLHGAERPDRGYGVAVLLRYTLRLLTLDQLGRAATLVCALEMIRQGDSQRLGDVRFSVGLWVGKSATSNTLGEVGKKIGEYKRSPSKAATSPFPLPSCPWCRTELNRDSLQLVPNRTKATGVLVGCTDFRCDFSPGKNRDGLPVLFVDEQIYRELPSFIVATVDKFAMLPWRGETGMLFGRVVGQTGSSFFGPLDGKQKIERALPSGLLPPELIVQDELHLIAGPLGTMVGLYETAIESLCTRDKDRPVLPKIIAATATVRRAGRQIQALFGRTDTAVFPPPGIDESESYFAEVDTKVPGRLYVGVAASGRAMKRVLLRAYASLLAAAQHVYDPSGAAEQTADSYMTLVGYFNSLRELGGMRRLVEDEVRTQCLRSEDRLPESAQSHCWTKNRALQREPVELTSRESTGRIAESRARLARPYADKDHVDVLLASNMISVGVDIDRLGLMVVAGQPKTTSEYIQASSRVGRDPRWPGLVVTCFNLFKPRDRSHYERFAAYHATFYRFVEAMSLTPFSGPALDRGLAGTLVAMSRLLDPDMAPPLAAMSIDTANTVAATAVGHLADRCSRQPTSE
jgi:hypothetical protein